MTQSHKSRYHLGTNRNNFLPTQKMVLKRNLMSSFTFHDFLFPLLIYESCIICLAGHLLVCFEFQAKRWVDEKKTFFSRKKDCWRQLLILIVSRLLTEDSTICYYWQKLCYCWWWWCDHVRLGCGHLWGENWHLKQIRKKKHYRVSFTQIFMENLAVF